MKKILRLSVAFVAAALVLWAAVAFLARENVPRQPPLHGAFSQFTLAAAGSPAPESPLIAADGTTTTLAAYRGKILLVNFWATWCAPCVHEIPELIRLNERLGGPDFAVVALSQDIKGWPVIAPFLARHGFERLPVLHDRQGPAARALKAVALPTTVLFDRKGREIGRLVGSAPWDSAEAIALVQHYLGGEAWR